jgi:hypothetical protein
MKSPLLLLAFTLLAFGQGLTHHDSRTGLTIHYPKGWRIDHSAAAFALVNFTDREREPQLLVPMDKAMIVVDAPAYATAAEYIQRSNLNEQHGYRIEDRTIDTALGEIPAKRLTQKHDRFLPDGFTIMDVFTAHHRLYEVQLTFRGSKRRAEYERTFHAIVKSLEFAGQ